ncbi:MAG: hypothetical protein JWL57_1296, partial [Actinobacteria bacterium]|nr:hypothetical protein [Actinomycetota bacterium]
MADVTITFGDNGSYHVEGTIT